MKYRILGRTGRKVSVIGVGTWQFGGEWGRTYSQKEADAILGTAQDQGINLIDTAECYGDHSSEAFIGNFLEGRREDWIVATKFGHKFHGIFERTDHWSAKEVRTQLEDSLKALKTDFIDLYQFHSGTNEEFNNEELWKELEGFIGAGKVRHLGISVGSNTNEYQVGMADQVGAQVIQIIYNRLDRAPEETIFPLCREQALGVLARVPLASGFLSGKYHPGDEEKFTKSDIRSLRDKKKVAETLRRVEEIRKNEVPEGIEMASWALAWCLKNPAVTSVIPGCKTPEQVVANAKAADLDMVSEY